MDKIGSFVLPAVIALILGAALFRGVKAFDLFLDGAKDGLRTAVGILPSLIGLVTAITMLSASGVLDMLVQAVAPATNLLGIPEETLPLALLRPLSGSGALAVYQDIITKNGPDSPVGLIASTMMGSSETTFYTIAVYFGTLKISNIRHTLPAALAADFAGFVASVFAVWLLMLR